MPWLVVTIILEIATTLWHFYLLLIVRQHWLNRKHGYGDAKKTKSNSLPEYILSQRDWVSELNQECQTRSSYVGSNTERAYSEEQSQFMYGRYNKSLVGFNGLVNASDISQGGDSPKYQVRNVQGANDRSIDLCASQPYALRQALQPQARRLNRVESQAHVASMANLIPTGPESQLRQTM